MPRFLLSHPDSLDYIVPHHGGMMRDPPNDNSHEAPATPAALKCPVCHMVFSAQSSGCPHHSATLVPADPLADRVLNGAWRLLTPLGQGGTALVYTAHHTSLKGTYAVKILAPTRARDPAQRERFLREAEAQGRIVHDNVIRVIEWGHDETNDLFFAAMEHVKGDTLKDVVTRDGAFSAERAVPIAVQILDAIGTAHDVGMLHRDLKPQNVMLTSTAGLTDRVRVFDFGGKPIDAPDAPLDGRARTTLTLPGMLFGTPAYMSPEQARGEVLDERSDIYAAAVVLLHMLLGQSPFRGRDITDTLTNVLTMQAPRPSLVRGVDATRIPPGLEIVLLKALNKDPALRFARAVDFKVALLRFMGPAPKDPNGKPLNAALDERLDMPDDGRTILDVGDGHLAVRDIVDSILRAA